MKKNIAAKIFANKKLVMFLMIGVVAVSFACAQNSIDQLDTWSEKILSLFQSSWVKAILLIALVCEAIAVVVSGQQGGGGAMVKKFAPWVVGTIILLCASSITGYFTEGMEFKTSSLPEEMTPSVMERQISMV